MTKQQILAQAWNLYHEHSQLITLGACIRTVCSQMATKEHKRLSTLDGNPALCYFNEHYNDKYEQQYLLEGV
jgi:hypothetical protein